ncbi:hypothetical protein [Sphingobacterium sp. BIGb0165]|uniref:hypothetical protein n=1 Tax=Sphingobacterium sp. BIGb0165 TaxID=2940615 RepID=UPI00216A71ED|nr:hypothetical protein [Sphingobacterium sp. BIGb0165]MCS4226349.1 hypothetical protein [Sphingobacterium sp. BIGb0165]
MKKLFMSVVAVAVMSSAAFAGTGKAPSNKTVETKAVSEKVEAPKMVHTSSDGKRSIEMVEIKTANSSKLRCTFRIDYYLGGQYDGSVTITGNYSSCGGFFCRMKELLTDTYGSNAYYN